MVQQKLFQNIWIAVSTEYMNCQIYELLFTNEFFHINFVIFNQTFKITKFFRSRLRRAVLTPGKVVLTPLVSAPPQWLVRRGLILLHSNYLLLKGLCSRLFPFELDRLLASFSFDVAGWCVWCCWLVYLVLLISAVTCYAVGLFCWCFVYCRTPGCPFHLALAGVQQIVILAGEFSALNSYLFSQ